MGNISIKIEWDDEKMPYLDFATIKEFIMKNLPVTVEHIKIEKKDEVL
jgi:hypothetical protein